MTSVSISNKNKRYYQKNKEVIREKNKKWRKENSDLVRLWNQTPKRRFGVYVINARKKGIDFALTFEEFGKLVSSLCHYCGDEGYGVDRKESDVGYVANNVVSCCTSCNFFKRKLGYEEFITKCIRISNNFIK